MSSLEPRPTTNRQWCLLSRPQPNKALSSCFEEKSVSIPALQKGQVLAKVLHLSFDPTQSGWMAKDTYMPAVKLGDPMRASGYGQIIESTHSAFQPGDLIAGLLNWQEYCLFEPEDPNLLFPIQKLPGHLDLLPMLALGVTGLTAYFGIIEIGRMKPGDAVLVSGAAGATGSVAGQVARALGAKKVIGIAGGPAKCAWLTQEAHFDAAIDYKNETVADRLKELCPGGVDVYFDNVGGPLLDTVLEHLAPKARIVICGAISQYRKDIKDWYGVKNLVQLVLKSATMEGFIVLDYMDRFTEGTMTLSNWVAQGQIVVKVDEQKGFENIPTTLDRLFTGANQGKQVLTLSDDDLPLPRRERVVEKVAMKVIQSYFALKRSGSVYAMPLLVTTSALAAVICAVALKPPKCS